MDNLVVLREAPRRSIVGPLYIGRASRAHIGDQAVGRAVQAKMSTEIPKAVLLRTLTK
jgi:hypothetical protein